MLTPSAEPVVYTLGSTVARFTGFFYQGYIIPIVLALAVLSFSGGSRPRPGICALRILSFAAAAAGLYFLVAPAIGDFTQTGTVSHLLLMALIVIYSQLFCTMQPQARVVLTAAVITSINFAQSISTQLLMPLLTLTAANAIQFAILALSLAVIYIFRPTQTEERIPTAYWLIMLVNAILSTACLYAIRILGWRSADSASGDKLTVAIVLLAFFIVNLLIYYLYHTLVKELRASSSMRAMQAKLEQDLEFYRRSETVLNEYKSLRHELKNHIALMQSLLRNGEYDKLRQYFAEYAGKAAPQLAEFICPNPLVSSVISHQMNTAQAAGVTLDVIAAVPETIGIEDDDLCSVLSNMLDNGVEACLRAGKKLVRATLHTDKGCLFITVTNPAAEDVLRENPSLLSTKEHAASHGFGIPILRRITAKYDGIVTFHMEDGWFTADAMMYMTGD